MCQDLSPDLTNALAVERAEIPTATLQNLMESLPGRLEVIIAAKDGLNQEWHVHQANKGVIWSRVYILLAV